MTRVSGATTAAPPSGAMRAVVRPTSALGKTWGTPPILDDCGRPIHTLISILVRPSHIDFG